MFLFVVDFFVFLPLFEEDKIVDSVGNPENSAGMTCQILTCAACSKD